MALTRCFQNFLFLLWRDRTQKIGFTPVVAFGPANFGRQVMRAGTDGSFSLHFPSPARTPADPVSDAVPMPAAAAPLLHTDIGVLAAVSLTQHTPALSAPSGAPTLYIDPHSVS